MVNARRVASELLEQKLGDHALSGLRASGEALSDDEAVAIVLNHEE